MTTPIIILVHPQLVENIGMTARAMANCALPELRIVAPRDPWPLGDVHRQRMAAASSGAEDILTNAKLYDTVQDAIADLNYVYATTSRTNDMVNRIVTARAAAPDMKERIDEGQKVGVLFGPERMGLINDYIVLANCKITIPLNPDFMSLNLAQCVLLVGYEWYQAKDKTQPSQIRMGKSRPATHDEYENFFRRLEEELDTSGYFTTEDMRPTITRNLQSALQRAEMTEQEIRTWHGVVSALVQKGRKRMGRE
ncbi:MAG: RNA methyltransferase [Proteobacteria bacterium]|jgi:tRNA/rRNA methyltransferase|nr:RNA methyltransferase [Alphaproteobacteria bacterium]NCC02868.1 RNA methyltransferase [Pseudomonadota bacterium]